MRQRHLAMRLSRLEGHPRPNPALEQYPTPPDLAARLLTIASQTGEIGERTVCDLGSGTGVLAIGAALLGASRVVGVEVDPLAIVVAEKNAALLNVSVEFILCDLNDPECAGNIPHAEIVVMNPPFGAQQRHADRPFIDTALIIAPVVYGIFNAGSRPFLESYLMGHGEVTGIENWQLPIRRTFRFHREESRDIPVEVVRIRRCPL
ncbi:MAG: METTL5 family protein [Methanomicrobiales archaeon]|nr:METTL5 family protein [Methanomicrobiales archaeon]